MGCLVGCNFRYQIEWDRSHRWKSLETENSLKTGAKFSGSDFLVPNFSDQVISFQNIYGIYMQHRMSSFNR